MSQTDKTCNKCNKRFKTETNFKKHINNKLPCDSIIQCLFCEKVYNTAVAFNKHTQTVTGFCKMSMSRQLTRVQLAEYDLQMAEERQAYKAMIKQKMIDEFVLKIPPRELIPIPSMEAAFKAEELRGAKKQVTAYTLQIRVDREKQIELKKIIYKTFVEFHIKNLAKQFSEIN